MPRGASLHRRLERSSVLVQREMECGLSSRNTAMDGAKLFTVPAAGGFPEEIPLPIAEEGSYSPDGSHLAYVPLFQCSY